MRYLHLALLLLLLILLPLSCQPGRDPAGNYRAIDPGSGGKTVIELELKSDGKGSWKIDPDEVPFTWEDRGAEVWLHMKVGGVIRGSIGKDGAISISLPDTGSLRFERVAS
jgi:hypothetical protein